MAQKIRSDEVIYHWEVERYAANKILFKINLKIYYGRRGDGKNDFAARKSADAGE